jgi:hypothetical protein
MPKVSIHLDRELYERLEAFVGRSEIASFVEEAVIERLEDWDGQPESTAYDDDSDDFEVPDDELDDERE